MLSKDSKPFVYCGFGLLSHLGRPDTFITMTRKETERLLPIMQAYADGKTIEYYNKQTDTWEDDTDPVFGDAPDLYRIKSEPKCRAFKSREECFEEMKKHEPFGWIKDHDSYYNIIIIEKDFIFSSGPKDKTMGCAFEHALDIFTFMDGEPFGIKEV